MKDNRNGAKTAERVRMVGACSLLAIAIGMASPAAAQTQPSKDDDQAAAAATPAPQDADTNNGNTPDDIVIRGRFVNDAAVSATKMDIRILDTLCRGHMQNIRATL